MEECLVHLFYNNGSKVAGQEFILLSNEKATELKLNSPYIFISGENIPVNVEIINDKNGINAYKEFSKYAKLTTHNIYDNLINDSLFEMSPKNLVESISGIRPTRTTPAKGDQYITTENTDTLFIGDLIPYQFNKPALLIGQLLRMFGDIKIKQCLVFNKPSSAFAIVSFENKYDAKMVKDCLAGKHVSGMSVHPISINYRIAMI